MDVIILAQQGSRLTPGALSQQNRRFRGQGGVSQENRALGFLPAFLDTASGRVYRACYADGRPAPMHVLDGLPPDLVVERLASGRVVAVRDGVVAGFMRGGRFYTREEAARMAGP